MGKGPGLTSQLKLDFDQMLQEACGHRVSGKYKIYIPVKFPEISFVRAMLNTEQNR